MIEEKSNQQMIDKTAIENKIPIKTTNINQEKRYQEEGGT